MSTSLYLSLYPCIYPYISLYAYICPYIRVCIPISTSSALYASLYPSLYPCMHPYTLVYIPIYIYPFICVYIPISLYTYPYPNAYILLIYRQTDTNTPFSRCYRHLMPVQHPSTLYLGLWLHTMSLPYFHMVTPASASHTCANTHDVCTQADVSRARMGKVGREAVYRCGRGSRAPRARG